MKAHELLPTAMGATVDQLLRDLANPARRHILRLLAEREPQTIDMLVKTLCQRYDGKDRESVKIDLQHAHLPRLQEHKLVRWKRDERRIRTGPEFDTIRPLLEVIKEIEKETNRKTMEIHEF